MYLEPSYYDDVVVLVKHNQVYQYYVTDKELWILDLNKLRSVFEVKGYKIELVEDERTGFEVLTKDNYCMYKHKIIKYKVSNKELSECFELFKATKQPYDDIREILPVFYIDFDKEIFYSFYTEPGSYEEYIPKGWQGMLIEDSEKVIPSNMVYWGGDIYKNI